MGRAPCCDKANVKKGPWSPEEDAKLKSYIEQHGTGGNWIALPKKIGLKRCGKSCRLRWLNYLRPNIKHGGFTEEEDNIICSLYICIGSRWSIIAGQLPGRTDNDIKNYWNTRLKKKLLGKQRKDSQQARRASGVKQEVKSIMIGNVAAGGYGGRSVYWPEPPVPLYTAGQLDQRTGDDNALIRKLLIKLGGRFDDGANDRGQLAGPSWPSPQQIYGDSTSLMAASANNTVFFNDACPPMAPANMMEVPSSNFPTMLDHLFHSNQVKLEGQDCFFGAGNAVDESVNWSEVNPSIYPPVVQSFQGMQQCLFEEQVHLGTQ